MTAIAALLLALAPPVADATPDAPISVRAGEHRGFSRIVIPPLNAAPEIATAGREITITLPGETRTADLGALAPKSRLMHLATASQSHDGEALTLTLLTDCECRTRVSLAADGGTVIDIVDTTTKASGAPARLAPKSPVADEAARAREALAKAITAASDTGVVRLKGETLQDETVDAPRPVAASADPNARASTSIEQHASLEAACALETSFSSPPPAEVASDEDAARDYQPPSDDQGFALALGFLKDGFYAEAYAAASAIGEKGRVIAAIAGALDNRRALARAALEASAHCGPTHRLFLAVAIARESPNAVIPLDGDAVDALMKLPVELGFSIAEGLSYAAHLNRDPLLAGRLAAIAREKNPKRKSVRLDIVERANGTPSPAQDERIAAAARDPGELQLDAINTLHDSETAPAADENLLADLKLAARLSGPEEKRFAAAEKAARLLSESGRVDEAVGAYAVFAAKGAARDLASASAAALIGDALEKDPVTRARALSAYLAHETFLEPGTSATTKQDLAAMLAGLGDTSALDRLLAGSDALSTRQNELRARAALSKGDALKAAALVSGDASPEARRIATDAALLSGDEDAALDAARRGDPRRHAATAYRLGRFAEAAGAHERIADDGDADRAVNAILAAFAARGAKPRPTTLKASGAERGARALFAPTPNLSPARPREAAAFAAGLESEIAFLKRTLEGSP